MNPKTHELPNVWRRGADALRSANYPIGEAERACIVLLESCANELEKALKEEE